MQGRKLLLSVTGIAAVITVAACNGGSSGSGSSGNASTAAASTKLIIEISGGFAYVPDLPKRTLEVAYLNDFILGTDTNGNNKIDPNEADYDDLNNNGSRDAGEPDTCNVDQIGTQLTVLRGKIVSPSSPPPNRTFDLERTVVTIPALDNATTPLTYNRPIGHPNPAKPTNAAHWNNLQYVPSLKDFHTGAGIRPSWRDEVNGRMVLKGGNVVATVPTDPAIESADFEFKQGTSSKGHFGVTDKIIYTVDVPGSAVELILARNLASTTLRIEPPKPGQPVRLKLHGMHGADGVASFLQGQEVRDFCAFYSLLEPKQPKAQMVKMFYNGPTMNPGPSGQPSPGYFCPGDGF
jgi:hypothetical protein